MFILTEIKFYDVTSKRHMKYITEKADHLWAGWLQYKLPNGCWVVLHKATQADVEALDKITLLKLTPEDGSNIRYRIAIPEEASR